MCAARHDPRDLARAEALAREQIVQRYGLEIDGASIPSLCARFGGTFG